VLVQFHRAVDSLTSINHYFIVVKIEKFIYEFSLTLHMLKWEGLTEEGVNKLKIEEFSKYFSPFMSFLRKNYQGNFYIRKPQTIHVRDFQTHKAELEMKVAIVTREFSGETNDIGELAIKYKPLSLLQRINPFHQPKPESLEILIYDKRFDIYNSFDEKTAIKEFKKLAKDYEFTFLNV